VIGVMVRRADCRSNGTGARPAPQVAAAVFSGNAPSGGGCGAGTKANQSA